MRKNTNKSYLYVKTTLFSSVFRGQGPAPLGPWPQHFFLAPAPPEPWPQLTFDQEKRFFDVVLVRIIKVIIKKNETTNLWQAKLYVKLIKLEIVA